MTSPKFELPSYVQKIGLQNCHALKKMTVTIARSWLLASFDLTEEELAGALTLAKADNLLDPARLRVQSDLNRLGDTAMWLCGASARQISKLRDVAPQTVSQKLGRVFKQSLLDVPRLATEMPFWRVELMYETWAKLASPDLLSQNPYDVASALEAATPTVNPEELSDEANRRLIGEPSEGPASSD